SITSFPSFAAADPCGGTWSHPARTATRRSNRCCRGSGTPTSPRARPPKPTDEAPACAPHSRALSYLRVYRPGCLQLWALCRDRQRGGIVLIEVPSPTKEDENMQ